MIIEYVCQKDLQKTQATFTFTGACPAARFGPQRVEPHCLQGKDEEENITDTGGNLGSVHPLEKEDRIHLNLCKDLKKKADPVQAQSHEGNECV